VHESYRLPATHDLARDGVHFRSKLDGRYVLFRGLCLGPAAKYAPFLPIKDPTDFERFRPQIALLIESGFTTLRLAFSWSALEPVCDPNEPKYDETFSRKFFDVVERFAALGFAIIIDIHQDLMQPAFGGNGFPDWVMQDGTRPQVIMKNTSLWGLNYVINRNLRKNFTQFWKNDLTNSRVDPPLMHFTVRDRFLDMIEHVAKCSAEIPRVLGIEIINEPHPGELNPDDFEKEILSPFYQEATNRIRKHSKDLFVFLAPQSDWNVNLRSDKDYHSLLQTDESDDRLVFAYHYYDSLLTGLNGLHFHERKREEYIEAVAIGVREARKKKMAAFLTEFGSRQNWFNPVTRKHMHWHFESVEQAIVSSTYWNVNFYNTKRDHDGFMREDFSLFDHELKTRNMDIAVRPYVLAASAEPTAMFYNDRNSMFELSMLGSPLRVPTVIYLPAVKHQEKMPAPYEKGFDVYYSGVGGNECEVSFLPEVNQLHVTLDSNSVGHRIAIVPSSRRDLVSGERRVFEYRGS
jgi:hypothetical protein